MIARVPLGETLGVKKATENPTQKAPSRTFVLKLLNEIYGPTLGLEPGTSSCLANVLVLTLNRSSSSPGLQFTNLEVLFNKCLFINYTSI